MARWYIAIGLALVCCYAVFAAAVGKLGLVSLVLLLIAVFTLVMVIAYLIFWVADTHNMLIKLVQDAKEGKSNIETEQDRRAKLVSSFSFFLMSFAIANWVTFKDVVKQWFRKDDGTGGIHVPWMFFAAGGTIDLKYPELQTNATYIHYRDEIDGTENRIVNRRTEFNRLVKEYEILRTSIPASYIAYVYGFSKLEMYEIDEDLKEVHVVLPNFPEDTKLLSLQEFTNNPPNEGNSKVLPKPKDETVVLS